MTDAYSGADITAICKETADIPLSEALRGNGTRKIETRDFMEIFNKRKPSIRNWYIEAQKQIEKTGESDTFSAIMDYGNQSV